MQKTSHLEVGWMLNLLVVGNDTCLLGCVLVSQMHPTIPSIGRTAGDAKRADELPHYGS